HLCTNLCSSISAHVFGVKQNVHVLVVVHGVGGAGALPALGSVRVAACARRLRRSDRCRLDMLAKGPWFARACLARARAAFGVSRVSMLRRFDFAPGLFSRFLCSRCALSRARQEGAVPYGMAGPHPGVGQATPLARSITWVGNI